MTARRRRSRQTSATNSTVVASPATAVADGVNTATVTVTLKDINKNPVGSGKSVTLSQGSGHSTIDVNGTAGSTATTDASGQAVFTVSDTTAEPVTYTATDTTDSVTVDPDRSSDLRRTSGLCGQLVHRRR